MRLYAAFTLRRLDGIVASGPSGFVLTTTEIEVRCSLFDDRITHLFLGVKQAYYDRPPVLATIKLAGGAILVDELPVPPDFRVGTVEDLCACFLADSTVRFSLHVLSGKSEVRLGRDEYLSDVAVSKAGERQAFDLVFIEPQ